MKIQSFSPTIRRKEMDAVLSCMVEEKIGPGDINLRLVQMAKEFFQVDGAVAFRSPATALKFAFDALGLERQTGVMISALAPRWQYIALEDLGYLPVVVDVSPDTSLVLPEAIEDGIKRGGRLILYHETMGYLPDFSALAAFNLPIIEDISQSAGSSIGEKKAGTFGVFSILGLEEQDILTAGGGALLMAPGRKEWIVLKRLAEQASETDILPDLNSALAWVQLKEFNRNEAIRKEMHVLYLRSLMQGKHKTFFQSNEEYISTVFSFPVVLNSGFKDVKQYAARKEIEVVPAFEKTVIAYKEEELSFCTTAKSLLLRCALFPLYPRLGMNQAAKVAKVLATLP